MAKEKKRGFFSWLGITNKTLPNTNNSVNEQQPASKPAATECSNSEQPVPEPSTETPATTTADELLNHNTVISNTLIDEASNTGILFTEPAVTATALRETLSATQPSAKPELISENLPLPQQLPQQPSSSAETITSQTDTTTYHTTPAPCTGGTDHTPPLPQQEGFFNRLKRGLLKTRQNLGIGFINLFRGKKIDDDLFEQLEEQLLIADVGADTTNNIIRHLTDSASRKQLQDASALYTLLKEKMADILQPADQPLLLSAQKPFVILMVGVNGVGKTTTIGKLAHQFQQQGKSVMLAAGDTFRAAAVEQLQAWGERNNITVIAQHTGADSASVIFDAIQAAQARNIDILLADTAGRLQNKNHLMEELKKIVRVMKKLDASAPHEIMLTLDASTGQNAISQTRLFHEAVGLSGITLTKLDGTAKGGIIFSLADQFAIPIRYIGIGEGIDDLRPFNASHFIDALFTKDNDADQQEQRQ